jgi:hypothetical protein
MAENFVYMHFSTYHWLPLVNGWSGFGPPVYMQLARKVDSLPSRQAVDVLSAVGVRALVVHHDRLPPAEDLRWRQEDFATNGLEPIAAFGADVIYKLPTVDVTPRVVLKFGAPTQLPAGTALSLAMLGAGEGRQTWMHPPPLGRTVARVDWMEVSSGTRFIQRQTLEFPIVIRAGEFSTIALPVSTPAAPGAYELRVTVPSLGVEIPPHTGEPGNRPAADEPERSPVAGSRLYA